MPALLALFHPYLSDFLLGIACLGAFTACFILFCRRLESRIADLQDDLEGRVIGLEVKEYKQDERLEGHDKTLEAHAKFMVRTQRNVDELGRDVGWDDNQRKTQVMLPSTTQNLVDELKKSKE